MKRFSFGEIQGSPGRYPVPNNWEATFKKIITPNSSSVCSPRREVDTIHNRRRRGRNGYEQEPTKKRLDLRPWRLQRSEKSETTNVDSTPFSSSLIDVAIPYIDPPSPLSLEEKPEVQKPLLNCTEVHNIKHECTEPLAYRRGTYAHFLSEDYEPTNAIAKLLVATERLDLQDTLENRPKKEQVLVTSHGQHKTYSIVVKKRHFDEIDWKDVTQGLKNLQLAFRRDKKTTLRMANSGDLLGSLPQNKMTDILSEIFLGL